LQGVKDGLDDIIQVPSSFVRWISFNVNPEFVILRCLKATVSFQEEFPPQAVHSFAIFPPGPR